MLNMFPSPINLVIISFAIFNSKRQVKLKKPEDSLILSANFIPDEAESAF